MTDRLAGRYAGINAERLAVFLQSREAEELLAIQQRNDTEAKAHRHKITGGANAPTKVVNKVPIPISPPRRSKVRLLDDL